ncbi:MAG TPA: 50S ribosomal protein L19, partial [Verrucomicrobiota bacterium]|nr:50S ribosomal protein L19 [Verrucomicrobiota bacterium]
EVERHGAVRRAKLTYLRKRVGKGAIAVRERSRRSTGTAEKTEAPTPEHSTAATTEPGASTQQPAAEAEKTA